MKIILSRKGFDSEAGGCANPILPDGTMLSIPIPDKDAHYKYCDLITPCGNTYEDILKTLNPKETYNTCHLDPDIRTGIRSASPGWIPAFGQTNSAQTHLENNGVKTGDLFLFFGWYRKTEFVGGKLRFIRSAPDIQAIYGYLQIGETLKGLDVKKCPWHPHSDDSHIYNGNGEITNNTIYVASEHLVIDGVKSDLPGAGVLPFSESRVLTAEGKSRTRWKLNDVFQTVNLSCHDRENCVKNGYFQSRSRGQEFVFDEDQRVIDWVKTILYD